MFDLAREIGQTLRNNRLRTVLTGISVAWGIFMLIILLGAARGVNNYFLERTADSNYNVISVWGGRTSIPHKGYKDGRRVGLHQRDGEAIMADNRGTVSKVVPFASADTATIGSERRVISGGFNAVFPEAAAGDRIELKYGRFINDPDIERGRRVFVIHEANARLLFGDDQTAVGKTVRSLGLAWTVVGVYSHPWRKQSYAPYTTYKKVTGNNDDAYQLDVTIEGVTDEASSEAAEEGVRRSLARVHEFAPADRSAVWTWNQFSSYLANRKGNLYLELAVWVIGLLTLMTGIVGVSNIMFVSVRERTHEIGIRRAIGAKPRSILGQVIAESVALTTLFGYIGVVLGMAVLQVLNVFTADMEGFSNPTVDISIAVKVTLALIAAGAVAGLFPALKATKVKPVEALRDE